METLDWGTAIIVVIILGLFAIPFVLDYFRRKRNSAGLADRMQQAARQQHCRLAHSDVQPPIAIGLDTEKGMLFFFTERSGAVEEHILQLADLKDCELVKSGPGGKKVTGDERITEIKLRLHAKDVRRASVDLIFYQEKPGDSVGDTLQLAGKWALRVNKYTRR